MSDTSTAGQRTPRVAIVGGDGIGPEVIAQGLRVIEAAGVTLDTEEYDLGGTRYLNDGTVLPDSVLEEWRGFDAIYLGAVGSPGVPPGVIERGLLLKMRFELDLDVNLRPSKAAGTDGTAAGPERAAAGHDFMVVRENTEGTYAGEGGFLRKNTPNEIATQGSVNTRMGAERAIRFAYDLAAGRRQHLTLVHKTNVLTFSGDLWERTFNEVGEEYANIETAYNHVDAACIYFVQDPQRYDVIVTDNLFGDILTDLGGAVSGGIGLAASANLNPARTGPSMFEPVHGSAPDIAGQNKANPIAATLSGAMMLDFLGLSDAAGRIERACDACSTVEGSTTDVADAVIAKL
jgi:3-isopropylmalate dehydrogenase